MLEITLLRLRALLARTRGDVAPQRDFRDRYRDMARSLGFEGDSKVISSSSSAAPVR